MRIIKNLLTALIVCFLCVGLCSCTNKPGNDKPAEKPDAEKAMNNFVKKLNAGNFVSDDGDYLKITAYSPEQVCFEYYPDSVTDYALMTLNNETFWAELEAGSLAEIEFKSTENALVTAGQALPNSWPIICNGNMFELFYNNPENGLEFVSKDDVVKLTLSYMAGYGEEPRRRMQDVTMTLDKEDPTSVRFTAVVEDDPVARHYYDDLDLTVYFGTAASDARVDRWMKDPVYPETRTDWTTSDLFLIRSVFMPGYEREALPFPSFASYALIFDDEVFNTEARIHLTDSHATAEDVDSYIQTLLNAGFRETVIMVDEDEDLKVYLKPLREDYNCYVMALPQYADGFILDADTYYDNPTYENLQEINEVLRKTAFAELTESEGLSGWNGIDYASPRSESWFYFYDYDLSLYVEVSYEDEAQLKAYMEDYAQKLIKKGFHPEYIGAGEDVGQVIDYYALPNGLTVFRYDLISNGLARLEFRIVRSLAIKEAEKMINDAGFPEMTIPEEGNARDVARYYNLVSSFKGMYLLVSRDFDNAAQGENYLNQYVAALESRGFEKVDGKDVGAKKHNTYYNGDLDAFVSFDYFPEQEQPRLNIDFVRYNPGSAVRLTEPARVAEGILLKAE